MTEPSDPRIEAARAFGVDLSLMRAMLRLTPAERLSQLDDAATSIAALRQAVRETAPSRGACVSDVE